MSHPNVIRTCPARRAGFTLIELLAVIAIIGVLAALTVVAVLRGVKLARNAGSVSNLRQLAALGELYSSDFKGRLLVYESTSFGASEFYPYDYKYMFEYLPQNYGGDYSIWRRPGDDMSIPATGGKRESALNPAIGWSYARNLSLPLIKGFKKTSSTNSRADNTVLKNQMPFPGRTMLLLETEQNAGIEYSGQWKHIYFDDAGSGGKSAVVYLDGHVVRLTRTQLLGPVPGTTTGWNDDQRTMWFGFPDVSSKQQL